MGPRTPIHTALAALLGLGLTLSPAGSSSEAAANPAGQPGSPEGEPPPLQERPARESVETILAWRYVERSSNPIAGSYLLERGPELLPEELYRDAREQILEALEGQVVISPMEQANLFRSVTDAGPGLFSKESLLGVLGGGGSAASQSYMQDLQARLADPWFRAMAATGPLARAGRTEPVVRFYRNCIQTNFAFDWVTSRCVLGLVDTVPDQAFDVFWSLFEEPVYDMGVAMPPMFLSMIEEQGGTARQPMPQLRDPAIEGLGELASREATPAERRRRIVDALVELAGNDDHRQHFPALVAALGRAGDPAGVPALRGMAEDADDPALESEAWATLAGAFGDPEAIDRLHDELDQDGPERRFLAARTLLRVGEPAGFEWAREHLIEDPPGEDDPDFRPPLVQELVDDAGPEARRILQDAATAETDNEWLKARGAVGLLQLGDLAHMDLVEYAATTYELDHDRPGTLARGLKTAAELGLRIGVSYGLQALASHYLGQLGSGIVRRFAGEFAGDLAGGITGAATLDISREIRTVAMDFAMSEISRAVLDADDEEALNIQLRYQIAAAVEGLEEQGSREALPLLETLLGDPAPAVRLRAAQSLTELSLPGAAALYPRAMEVDYGTSETDQPRTPQIQAQLLVTALRRFPDRPETARVIELAQDAPDPTIELLAFAVEAAREGPSPDEVSRNEAPRARAAQPPLRAVAVDASTPGARPPTRSARASSITRRTISGTPARRPSGRRLDRSAAP